MIIITVSFVTLFVNWYNNRLLQLIRQFFLIPNRINEFEDRRLGVRVIVPGYRSGGPGFDSRALPVFLRSSGSEMGFTQPREYN
jgi:hypothetical protein